MIHMIVELRPEELDGEYCQRTRVEFDTMPDFNQVGTALAEALDMLQRPRRCEEAVHFIEALDLPGAGNDEPFPGYNDAIFQMNEAASHIAYGWGKLDEDQEKKTP